VRGLGLRIDPKANTKEPRTGSAEAGFLFLGNFSFAERGDWF
jgi:hypothetical protein